MFDLLIKIFSCDFPLDRLLSQESEPEKYAPSQSTIVCVQAAGGISAAAAASCITTPLDTIKTRLQVHITNFQLHLFS